MPVVDINPNNSGTVKLGLAASPTQEYNCQVTNFVLNPTANTTERPGTYCEAPATLNAASSWEVSFEYLQDWGAANSLSEFFNTNDGSEVFFEFAPDVPDVPIASGSFNCMSGSYGGDAGSSWVSTGTCGMKAAPVFTPPVAADTANADKKK
jgi:hypothetical protein